MSNSTHFYSCQSYYGYLVSTSILAWLNGVIGFHNLFWYLYLSLEMIFFNYLAVLVFIRFPIAEAITCHDYHKPLARSVGICGMLSGEKFMLPSLFLKFIETGSST